MRQWYPSIFSWCGYKRNDTISSPLYFFQRLAHATHERTTRVSCTVCVRISTMTCIYWSVYTIERKSRVGKDMYFLDICIIEQMRYNRHMTTVEITTSPEIRSLAQMAKENKTPLAKAVLEYVESLLHISPKSPHALHVFGAVSKISDDVADIVPRKILQEGSVTTIIDKPTASANDESISIHA